MCFHKEKRSVGGEAHVNSLIQEESVPRVMWRARLPSDYEFDGVPTALAVLHQDRHRILPTGQRAGQRLTRSFCHPHAVRTASPTYLPNAFI